MSNPDKYTYTLKELEDEIGIPRANIFHYLNKIKNELEGHYEQVGKQNQYMFDEEGYMLLKKTIQSSMNAELQVKGLRKKDEQQMELEKIQLELEHTKEMLHEKEKQLETIKEVHEKEVERIKEFHNKEVELMKESIEKRELSTSQLLLAKDETIQSQGNVMEALLRAQALLKAEQDKNTALTQKVQLLEDKEAYKEAEDSEARKRGFFGKLFG